MQVPSSRLLPWAAWLWRRPWRGRMADPDSRGVEVPLDPWLARRASLALLTPFARARPRPAARGRRRRQREATRAAGEEPRGAGGGGAISPRSPLEFVGLSSIHLLGKLPPQVRQAEEALRALEAEAEAAAALPLGAAAADAEPLAEPPEEASDSAVAAAPPSFEAAVAALAPDLSAAALAPHARRERTAERVVQSEALRRRLRAWRRPPEAEAQGGEAGGSGLTPAEACVATLFAPA